MELGRVRTFPCPDCHTIITSRGKRCRSCAARETALRKGFKPPSNIGKTRSTETRQKISRALLGHTVSHSVRDKFSGANHYQWKGGISKHPSYKGFQSKRRKLKMRLNGGTHTFSQWQSLKESFHFTCPSCLMKEPEIKLSVDHIVPISKGGSDDIINIQPLCLTCNMRKHDKIKRYKLDVCCPTCIVSRC